MKTARTVISTLIGAALCSGAYARDDLPNYNALAEQGADAQSLFNAQASVSAKANNSATAKAKNSAAAKIARSNAQAIGRRAVKLGITASAEAVSIDRYTGAPSFIWADPKLAKPSVLALKAEAQAPAAAQTHLRKVAPLYGLSSKSLSGAELRYIHDTGKGAVIAKYKQRVDGIEVFAKELNIAMKRDFSLVSVSGGLSPRVAQREKLARVAARNGETLNARSEFALGAERAIDIAFADMGGKLAAAAKVSATKGDYSIHAPVDAVGEYVLTNPIRTKPVFFDLGDRLEPAYYVELSAGERKSTNSDMYGYVISAKTGKMLFRKNFTENEAFVYHVFADGDALGLPWDGPQGKEGQPNPLAAPGFVPTFKDQNIVLLESGPISTGDPWLLPIASETSGNNVDAYVDAGFPDGYFAAFGDFRADANGFYNAFGQQFAGFDYTLDPSKPANDPDNQRAAVTQLFYTINWLHDWYYDAGFDEASGNAQVNNFGRGGFDSDPLKAEAQDFDGTNNANMSTPPDGFSPRMQQFMFTHLGDTTLLTSAGDFELADIQAASFGPPVYDIEGDIVRFADVGGTDLACGPAANPDVLAGKIALIQRGTCAFVTKVLNAQAAGAAGVVVYNNGPAGPAPMGGSSDDVEIPSQGTTQAGGNAIIAALVDGPVTAAMAVSPSRDSSVDNLIVAHEWGHYISNRLIADAFGLDNDQGRAMGEGWADFHSMLMTVEEDDLDVPNNANFSGVYAQGGYADMGALNPAPQTTFFFGIRRVPYTTDMSKNALSFQHIEDGVPLPTDIHPVLFGADGGNNSEVHNSGEIWATTLWEGYVNLLNTYPFDEARERMKAYLVAGYKLTPASPTYLEARDALLAAIRASDEDDYALFVNAFAKRGMGAGAEAPNRFSTTFSGVVESFSEGAAITGVGVDLTPEAKDLFCDGDGVLDVGETGEITLHVYNSGFEDLANVTATLSSANGVSFPDGDTVDVGPIAAGETVSVSAKVRLDSAVTLEAVTIDAIYTSAQVVGSGNDSVTFISNFDLVPASTFDDGSKGVSDWNLALQSGSGQPWVLAPDATDFIHWGQDNATASDSVMESPDLIVGEDDALVINWDQTFDFEFSGGVYWDGGVVEYQVDGGDWVDAGDRLTPAYNADLNGDLSNVLTGRLGYGGSSDTFPDLAPANLDLSGLGLAGKTVKVRFRIGSDGFVGADGWFVDNIDVQGVTNLPFTDFGDDAQACAAGPVQADAGPNQTISNFQIYPITGLGSDDPDVNGQLQFEWSQVDGLPVAILDKNKATARLIIVRPQTFTLRLKVTAPDGSMSTDDVQITVNP